MRILKDHPVLEDYFVSNGDFLHVRCCSHILNIIVQDGLKVIDKSLSKIRECIKYVKSPHGRKKKFAECIAQTCSGKAKKIQQDVSNRWNSTFLMLESVLNFRLAFEHLELIDPNFTFLPSSEVCRVYCTKLSSHGSMWSPPLSSHYVFLLIYACLSFSLMIACVSGIGSLIMQQLPLINPVVAHSIVPISVAIIIGYFPFKTIDVTNRLLCSLMLLSITALVVIGLSIGRSNLMSSLSFASWGLSSILPAIPVTVLTLGFHVVTPFVCKIVGEVIIMIEGFFIVHFLHFSSFSCIAWQAWCCLHHIVVAMLIILPSVSSLYKLRLPNGCIKTLTI